MPAAHENDADIRNGLSAHAAEQADIRRCMAQSYRRLWDIPITEVAQYRMDDGQEEDDLVVPMPDATRDEDEEVQEDSDSDNDLAWFEDTSDDE